MSIPLTFHKLNDKWDLYYHLPNDNNWNLLSYKVIMKNIDNVEAVNALNENIDDNIIKNIMLFVMRNGITPLWEDPKNRSGGCFSFKVINKYVPNIWKSLLCALCGETLMQDVKKNNFINGITISPKKNFCVIKIWMSTCEFHDPSILINIRNLSKEGCIFKRHEPEF